MIINLNENVAVEELSELTLSGIGIPGANQAMGFFLTPNGPSLVIQVGGIKNQIGKIKKIGEFRQIEKRHLISRKFEVKEPSSDDLSLEEYELGFRNIAEIKIVNEDIYI